MKGYKDKVMAAGSGRASTPLCFASIVVHSVHRLTANVNNITQKRSEIGNRTKIVADCIIS